MKLKGEYYYQPKDWNRLRKNMMETDTFNVEELMKNKKHILTVADSIYLHTIICIPLDDIDRVKELSLVGEEYAKIAIRKNIRTRFGKRLDDEFAKYLQYYFLHFFSSVNTNIANEEAVALAYQHIQLVAEDKIQKKSPQRKMYGILAIKLALQLGDFEKAGDYLNCIYKRKKTQKLEKEIIYNECLFYSYIIDYFKAPEENSQMKEQLIECFRYYFDELIKGNTTLRKEYPLPDCKAQIAYLWYKWFSDLEWKEVSFIKIHQAERYGIE